MRGERNVMPRERIVGLGTLPAGNRFETVLFDPTTREYLQTHNHGVVIDSVIDPETQTELVTVEMQVRRRSVEKYRESWSPGTPVVNYGPETYIPQSGSRPQPRRRLMRNS